MGFTRETSQNRSWASAAGRQAFQKGCVRQMPVHFCHPAGPGGQSLMMKPCCTCTQAHSTAAGPSSPRLWELPSPVGVALACGNGPHRWEWPSPVGTALLCSSCPTCGSGSHLWEQPASSWEGKPSWPDTPHTHARSCPGPWRGLSPTGTLLSTVPCPVGGGVT